MPFVIYAQDNKPAFGYDHPYESEGEAVRAMGDYDTFYGHRVEQVCNDHHEPVEECRACAAELAAECTCIEYCDQDRGGCHLSGKTEHMHEHGWGYGICPDPAHAGRPIV
ncbi:hypothetical protein [Streptomyces noursei]